MKKTLSFLLALVLLLLCLSAAFAEQSGEGFRTTEQAGEADLPDILSFYPEETWMPDARTCDPEVLGEQILYYYLPIAFEPETSLIGPFLDQLNSADVPFRLDRKTDEEEEGGLTTRYYYTYTGPKEAGPMRFDGDDPCEAHLKITVSSWEGMLEWIGMALVSSLTYGGDSAFDWD